MGYFQVIVHNYSIPTVYNIITGLQQRFSDGQDTAIKRTMLLTCNVITNPVTQSGRTFQENFTLMRFLGSLLPCMVLNQNYSGLVKCM